MNALTIQTALAEIPVNVTPDDTLMIKVHVEYNVLPGDPAERVLRDAVMVDTEGPEPTDKQIRELAQEWLDGKYWS